MKSKKLNFIVPLIVYPFDIMVSFGETNEEIDKHLSKYNLTAGDVQLATFTSETVQGRSVMFSSNQSLIRLRHLPKEPKHFGDLQHEIFHCVSFIMWKIGMPLEIQKSDEAYAYLVGYVTNEIYKKLKIKVS